MHVLGHLGQTVFYKKKQADVIQPCLENGNYTFDHS